MPLNKSHKLIFIGSSVPYMILHKRKNRRAVVLCKNQLGLRKKNDKDKQIEFVPFDDDVV